MGNPNQTEAVSQQDISNELKDAFEEYKASRILSRLFGKDSFGEGHIDLLKFQVEDLYEKEHQRLLVLANLPVEDNPTEKAAYCRSLGRMQTFKKFKGLLRIRKSLWASESPKSQVYLYMNEVWEFQKNAGEKLGRHSGTGYDLLILEGVLEATEEITKPFENLQKSLRGVVSESDEKMMDEEWRGFISRITDAQEEDVCPDELAYDDWKKGKMKEMEQRNFTAVPVEKGGVD